MSTWNSLLLSGNLTEFSYHLMDMNWFILRTNQTGSSKRMPWINEFEIELEHICDLIGILQIAERRCKERLCKRIKKWSEIYDKKKDKGTFLPEDIDVFVISPNRGTFYFPELKNLNFGDWKLHRNWGCPLFLIPHSYFPYQAATSIYSEVLG